MRPGMEGGRGEAREERERVSDGKEEADETGKMVRERKDERKVRGDKQ